MLEHGQIIKTLKQLNELHNTNPSSDGQQEFYSKLALLELCGWIEECMDEIVLRIAQKNLRERENIETIKEMIDKNYGFEYKKNFRKLLIILIGIVNVEKLEQQLKQKVFIQFISTLDSLKKRRNNEAHTYIHGTTRIIDAPSMTRKYFHDVYNGLQEIEKKMQAMGLIDKKES